MSLELFHPLIQEWFSGRFEGPTDAQLAGWPAIAKGSHTLIAAPTGSGKTLTAFLTCIDRLFRRGLNQELPDYTQVVYVSPLKALSNDIQKNLATPLEEIAELARKRGLAPPEIRTAVRTGDTKASERQQMAKRPPHILITTPESLYILLTSESGRRGLGQVETLIVDEIHAVADDKRGSHLSLSVERLCQLSEKPMARIGLSATQRPIEEMARFLVGTDSIAADGSPNCTIVDSGRARNIDLEVELPDLELGPIATHEIWGETLDSITSLVEDHATTLVFVNTRRLVERVSHQLSDRLGESAVVAHHGSLSRATRLAAEEKLKQGQVKVCVATASLELGIDIGVVDLVCQIGSPRSIGLLLQRIGRSGHSVGGTPKGRLYPLTRDELLECAALCRAVSHGNLDTFRIPPWPLDILSQQIVASCAAEEWKEDQLFQLCRRAYPYRDLPRERFDQVVESLSNGFAPRQGRGKALLHRDGINKILRGRRGARLAALTGGGAIPETGDYSVVAEPEDTFVGTVNEDFAIESMAGDVFLLGNTPWKIKRVESGRVRVQDAQGSSPTIPFWLGEAPGRTWELSEEVTFLREGIDQRLEKPGDAEQWLKDDAGISHQAASLLVGYLLEGKRVLGLVPTAQRVVAERFFDESGGMQLVIHAPFGARINRAWGMALRKRICRTFDFELQASATDDGLNFALGPNMSFPLEDVFNYLNSRTVGEVLLQAVLQAPLFGTRWRWNATRSLALLRHTGGRKVPPPLQRMRSDDLLAAVFPAQVQCQDNAMPGDIEPPDHPLVFETLRDCLTEAMDLEGYVRVLEGIERGDIQVFARDTVQPSVFSHQILNAMPYAFLDDAPLEERRARAVSLRRALPEDARDLARLDPAAIAEETINAWPRIRDADELHDALLSLILLPEEAVLTRGIPPQGEVVSNWFASLLEDRRVHRLHHSDGSVSWVAAEQASLALLIHPESRLEPEIVQTHPSDMERDQAVLYLVQGWVESLGPFTANELAEPLRLSKADVNYAAAQLEGEGLVLRGSFRADISEEEFCDRRILARIHQSTIGRLRKEVEPVSQAAYMRFLLQWQHIGPNCQTWGEDGLLQVLEQLQGFEAAAGAWESEILAARLQEYQAWLLDRLCLEGEAVWGRFSANASESPNSGRSALTRSTPITMALRDCLGWLLDGPSSKQPISAAAQELLEVLSSRGASFVSDLAAATGRLVSDVEETLWTLAAGGRVTSDNIDPLRKRIDGAPERSRRDLRRRNLRPPRRVAAGRWSLLEPIAVESDANQERARQLLRRYGIVFPELLARERMAPRWRELVSIYRRMEARGEIRGGRFVSGLVGEQFALPEAVTEVREVSRRDPSGHLTVISACDPLNLVGILSPGEKVSAVLGNRVVYRDGVPVASLESGNLVGRIPESQSADLNRAFTLLRLGSSATAWERDSLSNERPA